MKETGEPTAWLSHLLQLERLKESGCQFRLTDLSPGEWMGLTALREGREIAMQKAREEDEKEAGANNQ